MGSRNLTEGEIALAQSVYGDSIDYDNVQVVDEKWTSLQPDNTVMSPDGNIYYPPDHPYYTDDFSQGNDAQKSNFIHEMGHVMQDNNGVDVVKERFRDGANYNYDDIFNGTPFHELPMEAQAEFLKDLWRKRNGLPVDPHKLGGDLSDPNRPLEDYEDVLPTDFPGGKNPDSGLEDLPQPYPQLNAEIPDWMIDGLDPILGLGGIGPSDVAGGLDPLVIDLDGDGIELIALENSAVYFDFNGDSFAEHIGWVAPDDALLVRDIDGDGAITQRQEIFSSAFPLSFLTQDYFDLFQSENGFAQLALLDSNGDGIISAADTDFGTLRLWQDANSDGIAQATELTALSAAGLQSIDVTNYDFKVFNGLEHPSPFGPLNEGHTETFTSTVTMTDGSTREITDIWFNSDFMDTITTQNYTLDVQTLFLPVLRGYGQIADLYIAASQDESLLIDLQNFVLTHDFNTVFSDFATVTAESRALLLKWAGIDENAAPRYSEYGLNALYSEFLFLKKMTGLDGVEYGPWFDGGQYLPYVSSAHQAIFEAWDNVYNALTARLVFQSGGSALFENTVSYNPATDTFTGTATLSQTMLTQLAGHLTGHSDLEGAWHFIAGFIAEVKGLATLSVDEISWLETAVDTSSAGSLSWAYIESTLDTQIITDTDAVSGTVHGTRWDDDIIGDDAGNILYGYEGDDYLQGGDGDDHLVGGAGNDYLFGREGNDTYVYSGGHDLIFEPGSSVNLTTDVIEFDSSINMSDVTFYVANKSMPHNYAEHFFFEVAGHGSIAFVNSISNGTGRAPYQIIDQLVFHDGTVNITENDITVIGTELSDVLSANVLSTGEAINYFIYGFGGDDTLSASSVGAGSVVTFDGGDGNDTLSGSSSENIFIASAGMDQILSTYGTGRIIVPDGYTVNDLHFYRVDTIGENASYDDALIEIDGLGSITIERQFASVTDNYGIQTLEIDGQIINLETQLFYTRGTEGDDTIKGTSVNFVHQDDYYLFGTGHDVIRESSGTDTLLFEAGMTFNDIDIYKYSPDNVYSVANTLIVADHNGNATEINLHFYQEQYELEKLAFQDGTVINLTDIEIEVHGDDGDNPLVGIAAGQDLSTDDVMYGYAGNDVLEGNEGNDTLDGGEGDDQLNGGMGNDIYIASGGHDIIRGGNQDMAGYDRIVFNEITHLNQLSLSRFDIAEDDLLIEYGSGQAITIQNQFYRYHDMDERMELFEFADGSTADLSTIQVTTYGTNVGETIHGIQYGGASPDDIFFGLEGNDIIYGHQGTDTSVYSGVYADYTLTDNGTYWSVLDNGGLEGSDKLYDIEFIEFADGVYEIATGVFTETSLLPPVFDFNAYTITGFGTADDPGTSQAEILDGGATLHLWGNAWKKIQVDYTFTNNTIIELDFMSPAQGEVQGIGFDTDETAYSNNVLRFFGTQETWGVSETDTYNGHEGQWVHYVLNAADYFTGFKNYMFFANDHDVPNPDSESYFRNLKIYESTDYDVNFAPVAQDDSVSGTENTVLAGNVLLDNGAGADSDLNNDPLSVVAATLTTAQGGTVALLSNGDFTYTPALDFVGADSFDYTLEDGRGGSDSGTVTLGIAAAPSATPTALDFNNFTISGYGTADDPATSQYEILDNGATLHLWGNAWKKIDVNYTITADTVLQFDFMSPAQGEVQGLGFDNNESNYSAEILRFYGTQETWGVSETDTYNGHEGQWVTYTLNAADYFAGAYSYMVFANDDDNAPIDSESYFRNVMLYEDVPAVPVVPGALDFTGFSISALGTSDTAESTYSILDGGATLNIAGNAWKKIDLGYTFTENTIVELDFMAPAEAEVQGIGFSTSENIYSDQMYQFFGTQNNWGRLDADNYAGQETQWVHYKLTAGDYFSGLKTYMYFANDHDIANPTTESSFRNVTIYEATTGGNETLYAIDGFDQLRGGLGADTFTFDTLDAFGLVDQVRDFDVGEGDILGLSGLLTGYNPATDVITNFLQITDNGTDSTLAVDLDGTTDGLSFTPIATLKNVIGLTDETQLEINGTIVV